MTGPVTSQYDIRYWLRMSLFPLIVLIGVYLFIYVVLNSNNTSGRNQVLVTISVVTIVLSGLYFLLFYKTLPQTIIVTDENITIDQLIIRKHIVINYSDIKSTRVYGSDPNTERGVQYPQILHIELNNGDIYFISANDFKNYNELKQAMYVHVFRHQ